MIRHKPPIVSFPQLYKVAQILTDKGLTFKQTPLAC